LGEVFGAGWEFQGQQAAADRVDQAVAAVLYASGVKVVSPVT